MQIPYRSHSPTRLTFAASEQQSYPQCLNRKAMALFQQGFESPQALLQQLRIQMDQAENAYLGDSSRLIRAKLFSSEGELISFCTELLPLLAETSSYGRVLKAQRAFDSVLTKTIMGKSVTAKLIGRGDDGWIFKITINGNPFAFKVFKQLESRPDKQLSLKGSVLEEITNTLFFNAKPTQDVYQLYLANSILGFSLNEWLDESSSLKERLGKTLREHGYVPDQPIYVDIPEYQSEEATKVVRINGIICDMGRLRKITPAYLASEEAFRLSLLPPDSPGKYARFCALVETIQKHKLPLTFLEDSMASLSKTDFLKAVSLIETKFLANDIQDAELFCRAGFQSKHFTSTELQQWQTDN